MAQFFVGNWVNINQFFPTSAGVDSGVSQPVTFIFIDNNLQ
jgi:hypothetical protein